MALSHLRFWIACSKQVSSTSYITLSMYVLWWTTKPSYVSLCIRYLTHVDFRTPLLLSNVFKAFLAIWALKVTTKRTFESSSTLFFESLNSPSTWEFIDDVWKLPCTMFQNLNLPFHGVLLDVLIENSCGPLINYDFCSTFDETSPFLASPFSSIFIGEN
jgi:hypothetical protein